MHFGLSVVAALVAANLAVGHPLSLLAKRQQPDAVETPELKLNPLQWGDVNFIQTTDTHGWLAGHLLEESYNGDLGDFYSFVVRMKEIAKKKRKDLFIVDSGDTHDGSGLSDVTTPSGKVTQPLLTHIPYDVLAIGNHELYVDTITDDVYTNYVPHWRGRYLTSNVYFKDMNSNKTVPLGSKYSYFRGEYGTRVLAFGFLFDFTGNGKHSVVNKVADEVSQPWFSDALTKNKPDVIVVAGHIGVRFSEFKTILAAIRKLHPYTPVTVLGGHLHVRDFVVYDSWAAGIAAGRYLETIGWYSVDGIKESKKFIKKHGYNAIHHRPQNLTFSRRYLDQNRETYIYHSTKNNRASSFDTPLGKQITASITEWRKKLNLSNAYGCAPQDYYLSSVEYTSNSSAVNLMLTEVLPKAVADPTRPNPAYFIVNSGMLRYDIYKGPFTLDTTYQVSPFVDRFVWIANVPIDVASQVLATMNSDGSSSSYKRKRSLRAQEEGSFVPSSIETAFTSYIAKRHEGTQNTTVALTPGYTTKDDLGSDGDDTLHIAIPYYDAPAFVGTALPAAEMVDLVFVDFIQDLVLEVVTRLSGKNATLETGYYGDPAIHSSTMWSKFAKEQWAANC
ncbi:Metallo-dependent phosphatase-like protein [Dichotomocladium elegans]|nr:Metallo-dependent phosphatase-like protein [Dichotomocladium elegans]